MVTGNIWKKEKMNWYNKILKIARLTGEYWITDSGQALYADGDFGDMNNEMYVIDLARNNIAEMDGYHIEDESVWESWKEMKAKEILEEKLEELDEKIYELEDNEQDTSELLKQKDKIWEMSQDLPYYAYEIITENTENEGFDEALFDIAENHGDPRKYAIKNWGWKRLEGSNIETWTLSQKDLDIIAKGLFGAYDMDVENNTFNIYVYGNNRFYNNVNYDDIENKDLRAIVSGRDMAVGENSSKIKIAEKSLYHGTILDNLSSIREIGLVPELGDFVKDMYGPDYEAAGINIEDHFMPLSFAADKSNIDNAVTAMIFQISKKLNKGYHDVTLNDIRNNGLIVKIKGGEGTAEPPSPWEQRPEFDENYEFEMESTERGLHSVEPGDYFTEYGSGFKGLEFITGSTLMRFLKRNNLV